MSSVFYTNVVISIYCQKPDIFWIYFHCRLSYSQAQTKKKVNRFRPTVGGQISRKVIKITAFIYALSKRPKFLGSNYPFYLWNSTKKVWSTQIAQQSVLFYWRILIPLPFWFVTLFGTLQMLRLLETRNSLATLFVWNYWRFEHFIKRNSIKSSKNFSKKCSRHQ